MARDDNPWQVSPSDVKAAAKDGQYDDCLACKVTGASSLYLLHDDISDSLHVGSAALIGAGGWSFYSGMKNLKAQEQRILKSSSPYRMGSRRLGVFSISATLVAMGIWRAFN